MRTIPPLARTFLVTILLQISDGFPVLACYAQVLMSAEPCRLKAHCQLDSLCLTAEAISQKEYA